MQLYYDLSSPSNNIAKLHVFLSLVCPSLNTDRPNKFVTFENDYYPEPFLDNLKNNGSYSKANLEFCALHRFSNSRSLPSSSLIPESNKHSQNLLNFFVTSGEILIAFDNIFICSSLPHLILYYYVESNSLDVSQIKNDVNWIFFRVILGKRGHPMIYGSSVHGRRALCGISSLNLENTGRSVNS